MKKQDEQIDTLFNARVNNYEETPSLSAWDAIEAQLPAQSNKRTYWIAASIAAVLLISTVVWNNILNKTSSFTYEMATTEVKASFPQKEFIPTPILIRSTTIVYIQAPSSVTKQTQESTPTEIKGVGLASNVELIPLSEQYRFTANINNVSSGKTKYTPYEPVTIIYKKGESKYPKLAKAASYLKQVGDGERPLIDFSKISTGLIARRENIDNSNN